MCFKIKQYISAFQNHAPHLHNYLREYIGTPNSSTSFLSFQLLQCTAPEIFTQEIAHNKAQNIKHTTLLKEILCHVARYR